MLSLTSRFLEARVLGEGICCRQEEAELCGTCVILATSLELEAPPWGGGVGVSEHRFLLPINRSSHRQGSQDTWLRQGLPVSCYDFPASILCSTTVQCSCTAVTWGAEGDYA